MDIVQIALDPPPPPTIFGHFGPLFDENVQKKGAIQIFLDMGLTLPPQMDNVKKKVDFLRELLP